MTGSGWNGAFLRRLMAAGLAVSLMAQVVSAQPRRPPSIPKRIPQSQLPPETEGEDLSNWKPTPLKQIIQELGDKQSFDVAAGHVEYNRQQLVKVLVDDYLDHGSRDPKWDTQLTAAAREMARLVDSEVSVHEYGKLKGLISKLRSLKCDDPRYHYLAAYSRQFSGYEVPDMLAKAVAGFEKSAEVDRYMYSLTAARLFTAYYERNQADQAIEAQPKARQAMLAWASHDKPYLTPNDEELFMNMARRLLPVVDVSRRQIDEQDRFLKHIEELPDLKPWVAACLRSEAAMRVAWKGRGGGYANTVSDEGWRIWRQQCDLARQWALHAHRLNPSQPYAATVLIELCWGEDDDSPALHNPRYWFEQAVKARPEHADAYTKYAWGLLPRWGGSIRAELAFARECLETQRFDTNIPHVVVAAINNVMRDVDDEPGMLRVLAPGMMKLLDQSYTQYLERATDPRQKQSLQQQRLYWAWKLDLPAEAAAIHAALEKPYDTEFIHPNAADHSHYSRLTRRDLDVLLARTGPAGQLLTSAVQAEKADKPDEAMAFYKQVREHAEAGPVAGKYAADRLQVHQWKQAFDTGQWVDLQFTEDLAGWIPLHGQWTRIDDRTVQGVNVDLMPLRLHLDMPLGRTFEMEFDMSFVEIAKGPPLLGGLIFARYNQPTLYPAYGVMVRPNIKPALWLGLGYQDAFQAKVFEEPLPEVVRCKVHVGEKFEMTVYVDGKETFSRKLASYYASILRQPALGLYYGRSKGTTVQFSNVRIRKLGVEAPADTQPAATQPQAEED